MPSAETSARGAVNMLAGVCSRCTCCWPAKPVRWLLLLLLRLLLTLAAALPPQAAPAPAAYGATPAGAQHSRSRC
jgi:hypothetical protein